MKRLAICVAVGAVWLVPFEVAAQTWVTTDIGTTGSEAFGISDTGTVVGRYLADAGANHGFVWSPERTVRTVMTGGHGAPKVCWWTYSLFASALCFVPLDAAFP